MRERILDIRNCSSIAIMGGTFDPIHYGHLIAAETVREAFGIDKIIFVPSGLPPHKKGREIINKEHRYLMTVLATASNPSFDVSRTELERQGYTYTIDTVDEIQAMCPPETAVYFITGADAINEILTWKKAAELLQRCRFIAVTRPGFDKSQIMGQIEYLRREYQSGIHFLEIPSIAISSSDIRERIARGESLKYLLPEAVEGYIQKFGLYQKQPDSEKEAERQAVLPAEPGSIDKQICRELQQRLSKRRLQHTLAVAELAAELARIHGSDTKKAYTAGLLHDIAKEIPHEEKLVLCRQYQIPVDKVMAENPDLTHSFLSAEIAERDFGVADKDLLNAIRYHTTGRAGMATMEKVLYIADMAEPFRGDFPGAKKIRKLMRQDLDKAMMEALECAMGYVASKNRKIHKLSAEALEDIKKSNKNRKVTI